MRYSINSLALAAVLGVRVALCTISGMAYDFRKIESSAKLSWTPCFDEFTCAKLTVPVDYSNKSLGTTSIAFIKLAGKNATAASPTIVVNPGGPGGSGVDLVLSNQGLVGGLFGEQYNIVSFDPRGVNNSGLVLDCFSGNDDARSAFFRLHSTGITNVTSSSFEEQYYSSSIYGEWCNNAVKNGSPHGYYVTTPAVARDLLTFVEAQAEAAGKPPSSAKLWNYGISYGTLLGMTFASMFPDRVERMVLDGVINADEYYHNEWKANLDQMDEAIEQFANYCHAAGAKNCSFWGPSPANILTRLENIILSLKNNPEPISGAKSRAIPAMATYSDLKALFINTIYTPVQSFPSMADTLHQIEHGNFSGLAGAFEAALVTQDANHVIECNDAYHRNTLNTIEDFRAYAEYATHKSKYIGDVFPIFVDTILCRSFQPQLPDSMIIQDPIDKLQKPTYFPMLFASNTIDPITPFISAHKMSARFPRSALLLQEAIGHTVVDQGASPCYFQYIQEYFGGKVPKSKTTCPRQYTPFIDELP